MDLGGADQLEARGQEGVNGFLAACNKGVAEMITALARAGCNTAAKASRGYTALMEAAHSRSAAAVQAVLGAGGAEVMAEAETQEASIAWELESLEIQRVRITQSNVPKIKFHCQNLTFKISKLKLHSLNLTFRQSERQPCATR